MSSFLSLSLSLSYRVRARPRAQAIVVQTLISDLCSVQFFRKKAVNNRFRWNETVQDEIYIN